MLVAAIGVSVIEVQAPPSVCCCNWYRATPDCSSNADHETVTRRLDDVRPATPTTRIDATGAVTSAATLTWTVAVASRTPSLIVYVNVSVPVNEPAGS